MEFILQLIKKTGEKDLVRPDQIRWNLIIGFVSIDRVGRFLLAARTRMEILIRESSSSFFAVTLFPVISRISFGINQKTDLHSFRFVAAKRLAEESSRVSLLSRFANCIVLEPRENHSARITGFDAAQEFLNVRREANCCTFPFFPPLKF